MASPGGEKAGGRDIVYGFWAPDSPFLSSYLPGPPQSSVTMMLEKKEYYVFVNLP